MTIKAMNTKSEVLANELYTIELGQYAYPNSNSAIMRVPGGWVYGDTHGCCFIPYNTEFLETRKEEVSK